MEFCNSNIKKLPIFSQKKAVLVFQETKPPKKTSYIFSRESFSYISGNRNPEKISLIFQETELFLYFRKAIFRTMAYLKLEAYSEP